MTQSVRAVVMPSSTVCALHSMFCTLLARRTLLACFQRGCLCMCVCVCMCVCPAHSTVSVSLGVVAIYVCVCMCVCVCAIVHTDDEKYDFLSRFFGPWVSPSLLGPRPCVPHSYTQRQHTTTIQA